MPDTSDKIAYEESPPTKLKSLEQLSVTLEGIEAKVSIIEDQIQVVENRLFNNDISESVSNVCDKTHNLTMLNDSYQIMSHRLERCAHQLLEINENL